MHKFLVTVGLLCGLGQGVVAQGLFQDQVPSLEAKEVTGKIVDAMKGEKTDMEELVPLLLQGMELQRRGEELINVNAHNIFQQMGKRTFPSLIKRLDKPMALEAMNFLSSDEKMRADMSVKDIGKKLLMLPALERQMGAEILALIANDSGKRFEECRPFFEEMMKDKEMGAGIRIANRLRSRDAVLDEKFILPLLKKATREKDLEDADWQEAMLALLSLYTKEAYPIVRESLETDRAGLAIDTFLQTWMLVRESKRPPQPVFLGIPGMPEMPRPILQIDMKAHAEFVEKWRKELETKEVSFISKVLLAKLLLACAYEKGAGKAAKILFESVRLNPSNQGLGQQFNPRPFMGGPFMGGAFMPPMGPMAQGDQQLMQFLANAGDTVKKIVIDEGLKHKDAPIKVTCIELAAQSGWIELYDELETMRGKERKKSMARVIATSQVRMLQAVQRNLGDIQPDEAKKWAKIAKDHKFSERFEKISDALEKQIRKSSDQSDLEESIMLLSDLDNGRAIRVVSVLLMNERSPDRVNYLQQRLVDLTNRSALPM